MMLHKSTPQKKLLLKCNSAAMNRFTSLAYSLLILFSAPFMRNDTSAPKYLFYLHGAVLEGESPDAGSSIFKEYQYKEILNGFREAGFTVESEVRSGGNIGEYAKKVGQQVTSLLNKGVKPEHITVVGGSKGALIAMHVSSLLKNKNINYVFLAACNDGNFNSFPDLRFYGNILSIYEKSDGIGESCIAFKNKSSASINHYQEILLHTGQGHQFLWKPMPEWMKPAISWANGKYE
jgi:hypothetical protein